MKTLFKILVTVAALPLCVHYLPGVWASDMTYAALAGGVLAGIYLVFRPVVKLLTKALTFLTLGALSLIIDAWLIELCALLMQGRFRVDSFLWALLVALIVNLLRLLIGILFH